jgi:hypothetical protein
MLVCVSNTCSLHQELPDLILVDEPLIFEVVVSHVRCVWAPVVLSYNVRH